MSSFNYYNIHANQMLEINWNKEVEIMHSVVDSPTHDTNGNKTLCILSWNLNTVKRGMIWKLDLHVKLWKVFSVEIMMELLGVW